MTATRLSPLRITPPAVQEYWSASRLSVISAWRNCNTTLDFVFYDTGALSAEERAKLAGYNTPLGGILIVHPGNSGPPIRSLTSAEFVAQQRGANPERVDIVAVAGVGSSALGTASLARDVADHVGRPVAGIVSGLGLSDVITEAMGGWFVFGFNNAIRDVLAKALDNAGIPDHVRHEASHEAIRSHFEQQGVDPEYFIYGNPASTTLLYLLSSLGPRIKLLVGHSKGNLSIENALEGLHQVSRMTGKAIPANPQIVTLGAVIWFDAYFSRVKQFIGRIDGFGMMNSRPDCNCVFIPAAWHSLNSALPGHLSVAEALALAGIRGIRAASIRLPESPVRANGQGESIKRTRRMRPRAARLEPLTPAIRASSTSLAARTPLSIAPKTGPV